MNPSPADNGAIGPVMVPANQPRQFYRGGAAIAALRGITQESEFAPEDWVGSTTTRFGQPVSGLSVLPDGQPLREAIRMDPEGWLGTEHVAIFGADPALLVKLLDTGQRLPVHCHPSDSFARDHFGSHFGKTEAWVVLDIQGVDSTVHIGFHQNVDESKLKRWVTEQDRAAMLGALNEVTVVPGDTVLIPAGLPHAIGAGVFVVELQQPTDLSITLEWEGFLADEKAGHLGVGFDTALGCVDRTGWGAGRWESLVGNTNNVRDPVANLFGASTEAYFRAERLWVRDSVELEPSFAVLVVLDGVGRLRTEGGGTLEIQHGQTIVIPHGAGSSIMDGQLTALRCRPPIASAAQTARSTGDNQ